MIRRISPAEALEKMRAGYTYIDVRTPEEFADGHPAGAFNVPVALSGGGTMRPNEDFAAAIVACFGSGAKLVLGCRAGARSMTAARALEAAGFAELFEQRAGWDGARDPFGGLEEPGWSRAGLPVETGEPPGRSWADLEKKVR